MISNAGSAFRALLGPFLLRHTPSQLAHGLTLGLLFGLLPKDNLLALILGACILWLPCNLGLAVIAGLFGVLIGPSFDSITSPLGATCLEFTPLQPTLAALNQLPIVPWLSLHNSVVLGMVLLSLVFAPILDLASSRLFKILLRVAKQHEFDNLINDTRRYQKSLRAHRRIQIKNENEAKQPPTLGELDRLHGEHSHPTIPLPHVDHSSPSRKTVMPMSESVPEDFDGRTGSGWSDSMLSNVGPMVRLDDPESIGPDNLNRRESPSRINSAIPQFAMAGSSAPARTKQTSAGEELDNASMNYFGRLDSSGLRVDSPSDAGTSFRSYDKDANEADDDDSTAPKNGSSLGDLAAQESSEISTLIGIGDVLRETMIEVVRFRPDLQKGTEAELRLRYPESEPIIDSLRPKIETLTSLSSFSSSAHEDSMDHVEIDEPNDASVGVKTISPMTSPAVAHNPSSHSSHHSSSKTIEQEVMATTLPMPNATKPPEPAEESLRYLIWHLNSLNREQRS